MVDWQTDIAIPRRGVGCGRKPGFWALAEVGHSKFFPSPTTVAANTSERGKRYNRKFISRAVVEDGVKGIRVWRTA